MAFQWFFIALAWASVAIFVGMVILRIVKVSSMPMGLRWEVYPIPHEAREKRDYGGSYMEETDWAAKHERKSFRAELTESLLPEAIEIGTEILTMKKVRAHNRYGIWVFSALLHWGIYLFIGWALLLILESLVGGAFLNAIVGPVGIIASLLGAIGALGLIIRRATSPDLAPYTAPVDYFNLVFLGAIFVFGLVSTVADPALAGHKAYIGNVLRFRPVTAPWAAVVTFVLFQAFIIYMPFSKMLHYIIKFFLYHQGLWDDAFKVKGSDVDKRVMEQLGYSVTWQAPHIAPGMTWQEQAQTAAAEGDKK